VNIPTQPKQIRAEKTRQKLIDATIVCLAKHGYTGTKLGLISDAAGVSRRPRQYYFPTRISLMTAVWREIRNRDDEAFKKSHKPQQALDAIVEQILDSAFKKYRTAQYLADLELKVLMPLIEQREIEADELWVNLFKDLDKPSDEIIAIRYLHVSLLRGLAIEYLSRTDHSHITTLEEQFKRTMHAALA